MSHRPRLTRYAYALSSLLLSTLFACSDASRTVGPDGRSPADFRSDVTTPTTTQIGSQAGTNLCADVSGGKPTAGSPIVLATCTGGPSQQFTWQTNGTITVFNTDMCVDASGGYGRDGDALIIWWCNPNANQRWQTTSAGEIRGINTLCATAESATSAAAGDRLAIRGCNGTARQKWSVGAGVSPAPSGSQIKSGYGPNLCAQVAGGSADAGTPVQLSGCATGASQAFTLHADKSITVFDGMCVDAASGLGNDGDRVIIWPCHGKTNQQWVTTAASEIRGINNLCITADGPAAAGTSLYIHACNGSASQRWTVGGTSTTPPADTTPTPPPPPPPPSSGRWVSGYYVGYQRGLYPENAIDFSLLTHIIVGRITPTPSGGVTTTFDIDATSGPAMAKNVSTRAHAAGRKAILMLGGAGEHADFVSAASSANRATFVRNLIATMDNLGYDGIDVDWEPIEQADQAPLLQLLKDLRTARPSIILTIPVGWVSSNFPGDATPWYAQAAAVVDQMNLMSYEMAGNWGGWQSWHSSALNDAAANHPSSISSSVAAYRAAGVPAAKLGIGIGFYGSCWRGPTGPRQAPGSGVVAGDNTMSYTNIMSQYYDAAARQWDAAAGVPYLSFVTGKGPQGCTFVSYDDEQSIAAKGAYVKAQGLGGAIVWTIGQAHFPNAQAGQQDPLLKATYNSIVP